MIDLTTLNKNKTKYNVTSDDRENLQVSEVRNLLIFKSGVVRLPKVGTDTASVEITHNLGYYPAVQAYYTTDGTNYVAIPFATVIAATYNFAIRMSTTKTVLTIDVGMVDPSGLSPSPDQTYTIKYYIYRERAN